MKLEDYTFDYLMQQALSNVPDTIDKRQGSIIYDALAPHCMNLAQAYLEASQLNSNIDPETAVGIALTKVASQNGVYRKAPTYSERKGTFNNAVPIGSRFNGGSLEYIVMSIISGTSYILKCTTPGEIGNTYFGSLIPIDYIEGLETATLTDIVTSGADEETDDQLRARYKQNVTNPPKDGNSAQYLKWATEYDGIGTAKVFPLWNGGNTVKVAITNRLFTPAESALVTAFQSYMDPGVTGLGNGVAPIGSKVTVTGGTKKDIDVAANVVLSTGYTTPEGAADAISSYLASIVYNKNSVSYMRLGSALLDCPSIAEISGLTINGVITDIPLTGDEIPVLNSSSLVVV